MSDPILEKIRALHRKTRDNSATPAERRAATDLMERLAKKHGVSLEVATNIPDYLAHTSPKRTAEVGTEPPDFLSKYKPRVYDNFDSRDVAKGKRNDT